MPQWRQRKRVSVAGPKNPEHRQKTIYRLTERGIDLLPVLLQMASWSVDYMPVDPTLTRLAVSWRDGGAPVLRRIEAELRKAHLGSGPGKRS